MDNHQERSHGLHYQDHVEEAPQAEGAGEARESETDMDELERRMFERVNRL